MGCKPSSNGQKKQTNSTSTTTTIATDGNKNKVLKRTSIRQKVTKGDEDEDDLQGEDLKLVTVPLNRGSITGDRRLSQAKEMLSSGRPISITLKTTDEIEPENHNPNWDDESRLRWKEQLGLMRHFYDWEEIPLDFFIDSYVGGEKKRRLSLSIQAVPHAVSNYNVEDKIKKTTPLAPLPHQLPPPPLAATNRGRSVSVAVPERKYNQDIAIAEIIPDIPSIKPTLPPTPPTRPNKVVEQLIVERPRAASVAFGENIKPIAEHQKKQYEQQQHPPHIPKSNNLEELKKLTQAASKSENERVNSQITNVMEYETRPRRLSETSVDQVYGRLGKPNGHNDRFEMENPIVSGKAPPKKISLADADKKPEQFKNMSPHIDVAQFTTERRNTRHGPNSPNIRNSIVEIRQASSNYLETKQNEGDENGRGRVMSDWL